MTYRDKLSEGVQRQRVAERRRGRIGMTCVAVGILLALAIYFTSFGRWLERTVHEDSPIHLYIVCGILVVVGLALRGAFKRHRD